MEMVDVESLISHISRLSFSMSETLIPFAYKLNRLKISNSKHLSCLFFFSSANPSFYSLLLAMRFAVYSAPVAHLLSFLVFTSSFGLADKNFVAKVYIPSFFLARSSLSVQAKISTLGFQLRSYFVCEALQEELGHLAKRHNFNQPRK